MLFLGKNTLRSSGRVHVSLSSFLSSSFSLSNSFAYYKKRFITNKVDRKCANSANRAKFNGDGGRGGNDDDDEDDDDVVSRKLHFLSKENATTTQGRSRK